jgi:hypothetical protein
MRCWAGLVAPHPDGRPQTCQRRGLGGRVCAILQLFGWIEGSANHRGIGAPRSGRENRSFGRHHLGDCSRSRSVGVSFAGRPTFRLSGYEQPLQHRQDLSVVRSSRVVMLPLLLLLHILLKGLSIVEGKLLTKQGLLEPFAR